MMSVELVSLLKDMVSLCGRDEPRLHKAAESSDATDGH